MDRKDFLKGWLVSNLLGWAIGCLGIFVVILTPLYRNNQYNDFSPAYIFIWLSLSASLGILQSRKLMFWNVNPFLWTIATILGWVLPATLLPWLINTYSIALFVNNSLIVNVAEILIVGVTIGSLQMKIARESISMPGRWLWIFATSFGLLILIMLAGLMDEMGYRIGKSLIPFLFTLGDFGLAIVEARFPLLYIFDLLTIPPVATLVIALPTGLIFSKYGSERSNTNIASRQSR